MVNATSTIGFALSIRASLSAAGFATRALPRGALLIGARPRPETPERTASTSAFCVSKPRTASLAPSSLSVSTLFVLTLLAWAGPAGDGAALAQTSGLGLRGGVGGAAAGSSSAGGLDDSASRPPLAAGAAEDGTVARARPARRTKPNPTQKLRRGKPTLPPLTAYRTAPGQGRRALAPGARDIAPGPTVAVTPYPPPPRRAKTEDNPYAPVGVAMGALRLRPYLEATGGYDDNPNRASSAAKGSALARVDGGFDADADWGRHQFRASLRGGYARYFDAAGSNRPDGEASASLALEATRDTKITLDMHGRLDSQRANSPEVTSLGGVGASVEGRPLVFSSGVGAAVTQNFGRLSATLRGTIDRVDYQDASLSDGSKLKLSNDSYSNYGASLRVGYEVSPGFRPFVEASLDQRVRDHAVDGSGYKRDSQGATARAGAAFELTRTLTGEASAGYGQRRYEDSRLADLRGPMFDAALIWSASPLTTVTLKGATTFNETTVAGASGSITRRGSVEISHALLRNLTLAGSLGVGETDYTGSSLQEKTFSAGLKADYNLTRSVVVRGSFTHERLKSTAANADYTANVFLLGLRLQR
jgi:hypothetical protein